MTDDDELGPRQRAAETKKRRTRDRLVSATLDLYAPVKRRRDLPTLEEIAEEAGVSVPTLYNHFSTKHELYLAALTRLFEPLVRPIETAAKLDAYRPPDLRAEIVSFIYQTVVLASNYRYLVAAYIQSYFEAQAYDDFSDDARISRPLQPGLIAMLTYGADPYDRRFARSEEATFYHLDCLLLLVCLPVAISWESDKTVGLARHILAELLPSIDREYKKEDWPVIKDQLVHLASKSAS